MQPWNWTWIFADSITQRRAEYYVEATLLLDMENEEIGSMEFDPVEIEATKPSAEQSKEEFLDKVASTGETVTRSMRVENPAKWFPDTPNLYKLLIEAEG